jgi:hypothetical protein
LDINWPALLSSLLGAVIGASAAIVSSIFTNRSNFKRQSAQLAHDAEQKRIERLATLRRDLYLKAVRTGVRANGFLGSLAQADFEKLQSDNPLIEVLAVGAQLQLVVDQRSAAIVSDMSALYGELQIKLIPRVVPIYSLRSNVDAQNDCYQQSNAEVMRLAKELDRQFVAGQTDMGVIERLRTALDTAERFRGEFANSRAEASKEHAELVRSFMRDLRPELRKIAEQQTLLLVELRRELDVGGDIEIFRHIMQRQVERMEAAMDQFDRDLPT